MPPDPDAPENPPTDVPPSDTPASSTPTEPAGVYRTPPDLLTRPDEQRRRFASAAIETGAASHVPASLRHIDWGEVLPVTHLFKGFRVAIHPSKLLLALVAVALIYGGMRALDGVGSLLPGDTWKAVDDEPTLFERNAGGLGDRPFSVVRRDAARDAREQLATARLVATDFRTAGASDVDEGDLYDAIRATRTRRVAEAHDRHRIAVGTGAGSTSDADAFRDAEIRRAYADAAAEAERVDALRGSGPGLGFYNYASSQLTGAADAVLGLDVLGGDGLLARLYRLVWVGPAWAFGTYPLYFSLLFLWGLVVLAVFGGAIARSAAVQVARDEKISLRSALRFSTGKFVSFLSAPLIPLLVIGLIAAAVGLSALLATLIGWIPGLAWLGDILVGLVFPVAALAGVLLALTLVGLVGGLSLMYPTIAAEGTDSFDAISRSFSYLYARPWRLALYGLVAVAYGVIVFLFARAFAWLVLAVARWATGLFLLPRVEGRWGPDLLESVWPRSSPDDLSYSVPWVNLTGSQSITAVLVALTVYFVVSLLTAFALSLYVSLGTIVYFLMRREVDATEADEVYLDPADEEYAGYNDVPEDPLAEPDATPAAPPAAT